MNCPLCNSPKHLLFYKDKLNTFYRCGECVGLFRPKENIPDPIAEKARYLTHNNDVNDPGYRNFVRPLVDHISANFKAEESMGLDFGSGPGPVIAVMLKELGYSVNLYDPYFHPNKKVLENSYDYIVCCEVMEHFKDPAKEFGKLKKLLKPGGQLICKTDLFHKEIDFEKWYYKNDPTHVFIYSPETLRWIAKNLELKLDFVDQRSPVFTRLS